MTNSVHVADPYFFEEITNDIQDREVFQRKFYMPRLRDKTMTIEEVNERCWHETWTMLQGRLERRGLTRLSYTREKRNDT